MKAPSDWKLDMIHGIQWMQPHKFSLFAADAAQVAATAISC
jgi:hypothetical protein